LMKIHSVGSELFNADGRTDGRTDVTKLIAPFCSFANPPVRKGIVLATDKPRRLIVLHIPFVRSSLAYVADDGEEEICELQWHKKFAPRMLNDFHRRSHYIYEFL